MDPRRMSILPGDLQLGSRFSFFFFPFAHLAKKGPQGVPEGSPGRPGAPKVPPNGTKIATEGCLKRPKTSSILALH